MPASNDESGANEDIKAKMRAALEAKKGSSSKKGAGGDGGPVREKAHGSEVSGGSAPKMHRRKAGGGGS